MLRSQTVNLTWVTLVLCNIVYIFYDFFYLKKTKKDVSGVLPTKTNVGTSLIKESDSPPSGPPDHQVLCSEEHLPFPNSTLSISPSVAPSGENFLRPLSGRLAAKNAKANLSV